MEVIKRYQNRKLYSTMLSEYVPLEYIVDLIKVNQRFTVIDNKTKLDIKKKTVKQALLTIDISMNDMVQLIRGN